MPHIWQNDNRECIYILTLFSEILDGTAALGKIPRVAAVTKNTHLHEKQIVFFVFDLTEFCWTA